MVERSLTIPLDPDPEDVIRAWRPRPRGAAS